MSIVYPTLNSKGISCFPKSQHGAAAGVILFFTAVAAAIGPLAMAAVSDAYGTTEAGFVLATAFAFLLFAGLSGNWLLDPFARRLQSLRSRRLRPREPREPRLEVQSCSGRVHEVKNRVQLIAMQTASAARCRAARAAGRTARGTVRRRAPAAVLPSASTAPMRDSIPIDHTRVDERLGGWDDVRALGARSRRDGRRDRESHLAADSPQFLDFSRRSASAVCGDVPHARAASSRTAPPSGICSRSIGRGRACRSRR